MFRIGKIQEYNQQTGVGFIKIDSEPDLVFFHIADLPTARPTPHVGEHLKFMVEKDGDQLKAVSILRIDHQNLVLGKAEVALPSQKARERAAEQLRKKQKRPKHNWKTILLALLILAVAYIAYQEYKSTANTAQNNSAVVK